jgi:hypothetical protein
VETELLNGFGEEDALSLIINVCVFLPETIL